MRERIILAFVTGLLAFSTASSEVLFNDRLPFTNEIFDACSDESIFFEGTFHIVTRQKFQDDGSSVIVDRINAHATGTGMTSGAEYIWNDTFETELEDIPEVSFTVRQSGFLRLIGKGRTPNALLKFELHLRFNSDGSVDVDISDSTTCPGN
jgi:hypothetical protein